MKNPNIIDLDFLNTKLEPNRNKIDFYELYKGCNDRSELVELEVFIWNCITKKFTIKGVEADSNDFGTISDESPEYGDHESEYVFECGNRVFRGKRLTEDVLKKYDISVGEYCSIVKKLEEELSFGRCSHCGDK